MKTAQTWLFAAALPLLPMSDECKPKAPPAGGDSSCSSCWRSALYPEGWTPETTDSQGRFLHDFSYAGYRLGEVEPPSTISSQKLCTRLP